MRTLERLTAYLRSRPGTEGMDTHHAELAQRILDQHAHELAEEIRAEASDLDGWPQTQHDMNKAADLIDPEGAL